MNWKGEDIMGGLGERNPIKVRWRAQPDDLIGGWCVTFPESDERTPATGAVQVADFCREVDAQHIADIHNEWLEGT